MLHFLAAGVLGQESQALPFFTVGLEEEMGEGGTCIGQRGGRGWGGQKPASLGTAWVETGRVYLSNQSERLIFLISLHPPCLHLTRNMQIMIQRKSW